jgi:hypothetical protein
MAVLSMRMGRGVSALPEIVTLVPVPGHVHRMVTASEGVAEIPG